MKQVSRRLIAVLCAFCMLFASMPVSAYTDPTPATPTDLAPVESPAQEETPETAEATEAQDIPEAQDSGETEAPTAEESETVSTPETRDEDGEPADEPAAAAEQEETDEPEIVKPEADQEVTGSDDITVTGSLEGNPPADYLIRFTPEKDQTLCLILTTNAELKATVTDENTGAAKSFVFGHTDEDGQSILTLPYYKVKQDSTYLIRLSGNKPAEFSIRMVKMSILKAEEEAAAAQEEEPADAPEDPVPETPAEATEEIPAEPATEEPEETSEEIPAEPVTVTREETQTENEPESVSETPEVETEEETEETTVEAPVEIRINAAGAGTEASVTFLSDAGIPEDVELQVRELTPEEQSRYQARTVRTLECSDESYLYYTKYLEITLLHHGEPVELTSPVTLSVVLPDVGEGAGALQAVRFGTRTARLMDSEWDGRAISFRTDAFAVFGIGNALMPLDTQETELTSVEVLGFSADAEVSLKEAEAPEVEEGLEVLASYTVEDQTKTDAGEEDTDGLWIKAELNGDAELAPMESVSLYRVEDGQAEMLVEDLSQNSDITELDAQQVAVVKDTGYRHLTLTVSPEDGNESQAVTLDGMMPKEAEAAVTDVTEQYADYVGPEDAPQAEQAGEQADETENSDARTTLAAYDISISHPDGEYQPDEDKPISVEILDERITAEGNIELWHIRDDGTREQVTDFTVEEGRITFEATGFSVYIVTGETYLRTYKFYTLDEYMDYVEYILYNEAGENTVTQTIKNGETPLVPQNPVNPQNPGATFAGWYEGQGSGSSVTLEAEPYDFDHIPEITVTEEIHLYAKFIESAYVVFHGQYDDSDDVQSFPVAFTRRAELIDGSARVKISDLTVSYEGNGNTMVFSGWSDVSIQEPGAALNDGGSPVSPVVTDNDGYYTIHQTTHLYPIFEPVYWISFYSGPSSSGATYYRETCYNNGEGPENLSNRIPTRDLNSTTGRGYSFAGWYADAALDASGEVLTDAPAVKIVNADGSLVTGATADGIAVTGGMIRLTKDVRLYAAWTVDETANYTVVIEKQKATDAADTDLTNNTYEYSESFVRQGTIDTTVTAGADDTQLDSDAHYNNLHGTNISGSDNPYKGYTYSSANSDTNTTVTADGSAVLYIRYDWTAKPDPTDWKFTLTFADSVEAPGIPSSSLPISENNVPYGTELASHVPTDNPTAGNSVGYTFTGWFADQNCTTRVFFTRADYEAYTGSKVLFETMPGTDLTIYAGWKTNWYIVSIDPNYGVLPATGATWFWAEYGEKIQEYNTTTRRFVESDTGTWYYVMHDRSETWPDRLTFYTQNPSEATEFTTFKEEPDVYRYAGWYEVKEDGTEEPYDFSEAVDHDITIRLHWTKTGVFYLEYDPGIGTLNGDNDNEKLYVQLDGGAYNDDADVVVTRVAVPPAKYEFAGWTIRGDESGKIYRPGETFRLLSADAATVQGKRRVYLDAVYTRVELASVIYDPNGGTVDETAIDYGSDDYDHSYDSKTHRVTVTNRANNSRIILSDGSAWLSRDGVEFAGWCSRKVYDPDDPNSPLLDPKGTDEFNIDTQDPEILYAIWKTKVRFHLNHDTGTITSGWGDWGTDYVLDPADVYTHVAYLDMPVNRPESVPVSSDSTEMFLYWATKDQNDTYTQYDFSEPVSGALELYAVWGQAMTVNVRALDSSEETITDETTNWTATDISLDRGAVTLDDNTARNHMIVPDDYQFAFAAVHGSGTDVSESEKVKSIRYDPEAGEIRVTLADNTEAALGERSICFIYYKTETLTIRYMDMAIDGVLTQTAVDASAPVSAADLGEYDLKAQITAPMAWAGKTTGQYAYAIGSDAADNVSKLTLITDTSETDSARPVLTIENTWRGFRYTTDGTTWQKCGYDVPGLYVVYSDRQATVVSFGEETHSRTDNPAETFIYDYWILNVNRTTGEETVIYGPDSENYHIIELHNGDVYSAILFTDANTTQKIIVKQTPVADYMTTVDGTETCEYSFTAEGDEIGVTQNVTFVNSCGAETIEAHVAQVRITDGTLLLTDSWRTGETSFQLAPGEEKEFRTTLTADEFVTGQDEYEFGAIFQGTDDGETIIPQGELTVASIAFEAEEDGGSIYDIYLKDSNGNRLGKLGTDRIYYLYYPKLTIWYMLEGENGALTKVKGSLDGTTETDTITYGRAALTLNGETVQQNQKVSMPLSGLTISQTVGSGNYNLPPLLDNGIHTHELVYSKLGIIPQADTSCQCDNTSDFAGSEKSGISEDLVLYMQIVDNKLQWRFENKDFVPIDNWPVVYAIYRERGYELDITKTVPIDTGYREPFTITVTSTSINRQKYSVEGTGYTEITATPAEGQMPGEITFTVLDGSIVKLFGLGPGEYTVTETGNANYILEAKDEENETVPVTDNSTVSLTLDAPKTLKLINNSKRICKIGHEYFYSLKSAIQYIEDYAPNFTGTIEMLVDYPMPSSDAPEIPSYCNITLTTAAEDRYKTCGDTAVITRSDIFTSGAMITNLGKLTLKNVIIDGNSTQTVNGEPFSTGSAMIDNAGTLNIGAGSVLRNAVCTGNGAAVNSWNGAVNVTGGTVTGCEAKLGGAIYASAGTVEISSGTVKGNHADKGGAVYYAGSSTVTVSGGTVEENATENGGAVYMASGSAYVTGGTIQNNEATKGGGAIHAQNAYVTISGGEITGNKAGENGGAVLMETLTLTLDGGTVTNNEAGENGGAFWGGIGSVVITDGTVTGNKANGNGGAVYTDASDITVSGGSIEDNTAMADGGGVCSASGPVTVSGGSIAGNTAGANGGGVCSSSGVVSISATLTGNTATGNGGAAWIGTGTATLDGCTMSENTAANGAAIFAEASTINFTGGSLTGNTADDGGAVGVGTTEARLNFSGSINVTGNHLGTGDDAPESNVYLDQDSDIIINVTTLDSSAMIGVYVPDLDPVFENRGVPSAKFGSFSTQNVSAMFKNDRTANIKVKADSDSKKLIWVRNFNIKVYYIDSYANGLPYENGSGNPPGSLKKTSEGTPPSNENVISEIAEDVRLKGYNCPSTAIFGNAYREGSVSSYGDYITNVNWDEEFNRWDFVKADGTEVHGGSTVGDVSTLILIYTEPYYISIENNTLYPLKISDLSVKVNGTDCSIITRTGVAGYGYIYAKNKVVQNTLLPVTDSDPDDGFDDLVIGDGESIQILVPGGKNMPITLTGQFVSAAEDIPYTQTGLQDGNIPATDAAVTFTLDEGSIPAASGGTSEIIFGGDKDVCKVVVDARIDGVDPGTFVREAAGSGETEGKWEYAFRTPKQALAFISQYASHFTDNGKLTAKIEMTSEYMITAADQIQLPTNTSLQYDITLTTAVTGTFQYAGTDPARRATISRETNNEASFITSTSGDNVSVIQLKNLIFDGKNYSGSIDGGAVKTKDWNVSIDNVDFNYCVANNGGGIYIDYTPSRPAGGSLTVTNTRFYNCESKSTTSRQGGGAIWTSAKSLTVDNCSFNICTGVDQGGAIFHRIDTKSGMEQVYATDSVTQISNTVFTNCDSRSGGGVESDAHHITFTGCSFTDCYSVIKKKATGGSGGAIATWIYETGGTSFGDEYQTELNIIGCTFTRCTAAKGSSNISGNGGAIRSHSLNTVVTGSTFIDCVAERNGGAICVNNQKASTNAYTATISGCTIKDCSSTNEFGGGGIYSKSTILTIDNGTTIQNCTSTKDGGGVCHDGAVLIMTETTISNCSVTPGTNGGGGVYSKADTVTITDCTIQNCAVPSSNRNGGGVYLATSSGTATFSNTVIEECTAKQGGGLYQNGGTLILKDGSSISRNIADSDGGGIYTGAASVTLEDSELVWNNAGGNGGGICQHFKNVTAANDLTVDGSVISNNIAGGKGGGVFTRGSLTLKGITSITDNKLYGETAANAAGVYLENGVKITTGETGSNEMETVLTVKGNMTENGVASDLRMPESSGVNANCVRVYCGLGGEIRVVNANKRMTQFGQTVGGCTNPAGFSDLGYVFVADDDSLFGIVDRSDASGTKIIWGGDPICKITDANGRLLYLDENYTRPAVFDRLDDGSTNANKTSAFGVLRADNIELYYANTNGQPGKPYTGSTYQIKMLVEDYTAEKAMTATGGIGRTIILTTAGSKDSLYPYRGRTGTRSTILRAANTDTTTAMDTSKAMITAQANLTLQNIVLDGNSGSITPTASTRIINADFGKAAALKVTLGRNSTLQNAEATGNGGGVYVNWGATLSVEGGGIRNCKAANGGGVYIDGGAGTMSMTAGTITKCTATANGGGIYYNKGASAPTPLTISGGTISRCEAVNGGGIYLNDNNLKLEMTGGTINGNHATTKGGGIAVASGKPRIYFSGAPYVYGNTCDASVAEDMACNVEMNQTLGTGNNPTDAIIISKGLIRGATIGIYVPGADNHNDTANYTGGTLFDRHGGVGDRFARYEGSAAGMNYFVNDRNGMKGGKLDNQPDTDKKIYWRIIYALEVTKQVLSDEASDMDKEFDFTVMLDGTSRGSAGVTDVVPGTSAREINGDFGDMYFVDGVAHFKLKSGETKTAELLPLGFEYYVTENLSDKDEKRFKTSSINDAGDLYGKTAHGEMGTPDKYTYSLSFSNLAATCKITDPVYGLLYTYNPSTLEYVPEVYSNLARAFNKVNAGDSREWYYKLAEGEFERVYPTEYRIEMLIPEYDMDYPESLASLIHGKKATLTTADPRAEDGFPYVGGNSTAKIVRAVTGESMFTVFGNLILDDIILDGGNGAGYTCEDNGGILRVTNGGELTISTGVGLQNSTTQKNGAGIYLAEGSKLNISGNPSFSGNTIDASAFSSETNGGDEAYNGGTARQDIYIAGYEDKNATSLVVTGDLDGDAGSIWVWAEDKPHYHQRQQFAVMQGGVHRGLKVFRNARTDTDTINNTNPKAYLHGESKTGDNINVYWSGSPIVTVTKTLIYPGSTGTLAFSYEATLLQADGTTPVTNCPVSETMKTDEHGKVTFSLRTSNGAAVPASIELLIPKDYKLKIEEISLPPPSIYQTTINTETENTRTTTVTIKEEDRTIAFTNERLSSDTVVLAISKQIAGNVRDEDKVRDFQFEITGVSEGDEYIYERYVRSSDGTAWISEGSATEVTVGADNRITFCLKDGQRIVLLIPKGRNITVEETDHGDFTPGYTYSLDEKKHPGAKAEFTDLTQDVDIDFINEIEYSPPAPTGIISRHIPFFLLLLFGMILVILSGGWMLTRRGGADAEESRKRGESCSTGLIPNADESIRKKDSVRVKEKGGIPRPQMNTDYGNQPPGQFNQRSQRPIGPPPCPRANLWAKPTGSIGKRGDPGL